MTKKEEAIKLVYELFHGIKDKAGAPYVNHCLTVGANARNIAIAHGYEAYAELVEIAGILHDVVEDTYWTTPMIIEKFGPVVAFLVHNVTKLPGESKIVYFNRVKLSPLSVIVKIADSDHNSDITRFKNPTPRNYEMSNRYKKNVEWLKKTLVSYAT